MSFDAYFQSFADGDAADAGRDRVVGVLAPYLKPSPEAPERIEHPAGQADIFGLTDDASMMVSHIEDGLWDLLVAAARAGRWAIMPVGCPTCAHDEAMLAELPDELRVDAVIVSSGDDVRAVLARS